MDADDGSVEPTQPASPDPAVSYPRGNRLGLRHPRPTVVIVVAVLLAVGGAWAWQSLRPSGYSCTVTSTSGPVAGSADEAFQAWWDAGGTRQAMGMAAARGEEVGEPGFGDFVKEADRTWEWQFDDDALVVVHVDDRYSVVGVNRCDRA